MFLPDVDAFLDTGEIASFGRASQAGADGVEIDVNHAGGDGSIIEEGPAFKAAFPETSLDVIFFVGDAGDMLVETAHEPAQAG